MEIIIFECLEDLKDFEISNYGDVYDKKNNTYLQTKIDKKGYGYVRINKKYYIHKMVAKAFLKDYTDNCKINHIDGDLTNNKSENLEISEKKDYGAIARQNGEKFETEVVNLLNKEDSSLRKHFLSFINQNFEYMIDNVEFARISGQKVKSISGKSTTSKADVWMIIGNERIPISLKMTNAGTQLHISPLSNFLDYMIKQGCKVDEKLKKSFQKFLGEIEPNDDELKMFNPNRSERNKSKRRYWMNELGEDERNIIIDFLKKYKNLILKYIYCEGMCLEDDYKANIFIMNKKSYTETREIDPIFLTFEQVVEKFGRGEVKITRDNSLELSEYIGIQMKGSGQGASYHSLQFKDRGYKI